MAVRTDLAGGLAREYVAPEDLKKTESMELTQAMYNHQVKSGKLNYYKAGANPEQSYAILNYGESKIPVYIPVTELVIAPQEIPKGDVRRTGRSDQTPAQWVTLYVENRLGSTINYMVTRSAEIDGETVFVGSRARAAERERNRFFFPKTGEPLHQWDTILARVVCCFQHNIIAEAGGCEVSIPRQELAWIYPADPRDVLSRGDVIKVCVTDLDTDEENRQVKKFTLSKRLAEEDTTDTAAEKYNPGDRVIGTILNVLDNGCLVSVNDEVIVMCHYGFSFNRPVVGQKVILQIEEKREDRKGKTVLNGYIRSKVGLQELSR